MVEKNKEKGTFEKELEPLMGDTPIVVINGKEYQMRRLGMQDTFTLARIMAMGAAGISKEFSKMEMTAETAIGLLVVAFPYADKYILPLFASLLGVSEDDIRDPEKFPMGSEMEIAKALIGHVDVKAFFTKVTVLMDMPVARAFLKKISISSKKDMGGKTKK